MNAPSLASARADALQREAAAPDVSAFVSASAGSGKTKLLIDRLLRLMLRQGADPARILCLTFTKAAAAEMALRLQRTLGQWVTLDDGALREELKQRSVTPDAQTVVRARELFARVLDLPGGMRISTIHAFCQSLLRRFPLEASLAPHFSLMETADEHAALTAAREDAMADADPQALAMVAGLLRDGDFGQLVAGLAPHAGRLEALLQRPQPARLLRLQQAVGVNGDEAAILAAAVAWPDGALREAALRLKAAGSDGDHKKAERMLGWLGLPPALRQEHWAEWLDILLTGKGTARQLTAKAKAAGLEGVFAAECERVLQVEDDRSAVRVAAITDALLTLAGPVLAGLGRRKALAGLLDYNDLIERTTALLRDPGAAWVLFKLDGGLDHLLLDEVQDTAPAQWDIAGALTAEFFAGHGAEDRAQDGRRTVFAVGDRKQSIYSFQGADPAGFDLWRGRMGAAVRAAGGAFRDTRLDVSFRSTPPVLALVDAVFADPEARKGVVEPGETLRHEPHRAGQAGRVELWPPAPMPEQDTPEDWAVADRNHGLTTAPQRLADALAHWLQAQIGQARLPSRGRALEAGDVLVLVRRRDAFARALVRRLKALGVPVAGLDRLYLTDQPAVQDLLALCDTLLLPEDDLSLACVLTSPLAELDDDDLMELAIGRHGTLWDALRARRGERANWCRAAKFIEALMARVDYLSPHAMLTEALGPLGGRARLLRRLGPEAAEPIDELLGASLAYAAAHPPSLQGFVHWLRQSGAEVKREAEAAGRTVRVMTVHGAKGLQAPLVILPDTVALPPGAGPLYWTPDGTPLWSPRAELRCGAVRRLRDAQTRAQLEEYNRQLYVALTRAEDWLVVCGWQTKGSAGKGLPHECWYEAVRRAMGSLDASAAPLSQIGEAWPGDRLVHESAQTAPPQRAPAVDAVVRAAAPAWVGGPPEWVPHAVPGEPARPAPLAPSRPVDAWLGPVPAADSPLAGGGGGLQRGALIHRLLQHAPSLPLADRPRAIAAYLAAADADPAIALEVTAILDHPELAPLFGPDGRAEQPVAGIVGDAVVSGIVDRLAVLPDAVLVVDFKTNRDAPATAEATPVLYLRQMAAYRAVLRAIFPGRAIRCALVWTRTATVMTLPAALLDTASRNAHSPGLSVGEPA